MKRLFEKIWTRNYAVFFLTIWTVLVAASVTWNLYQNHRGTIEKARIEARTILQHNLAYRRWNTLHGGVYLRVSDAIQPNPFIIVPERDLETKEGVRLTLINPFLMTKQTYELLRKQSPLAAVNRTVSLNPLNPDNAADDWERKALLLFEEGRTEVSEITEISGRPYMRLLKPYVTETGCLKCHGSQGYRVGDIRGGMSISVPMEPYYDLARPTNVIILLSHLALWLIGAGTIFLLSRGMKNYQKEITENEKKFRIVSEFAFDFEFWTREDGSIAFISPSCERITGYTTGEFIGNPELLYEIIHPDDREMYRGHLVDATTAVDEDIEFRIITKGGQQRWVSHMCSAIFVDGVFLGRRGSNRDITDRKRLEEQLFQSQKMESLGHFACGVAHDFNNLLSAINGCAYLLNESLQKSGDGLTEFTRQILVASKLGKNLTSNLLAFGRKQIANPGHVLLNTVIGNISDILKTLISEEIDLKVSLSAEELPVFADHHQIEQVIINLCANAKDAMPHGGQLEIRTSLLVLDRKYPGKYAVIPPATYMVISVRDTGTGIDAEHMDHIFEPFYTTKDKDRGTGLGLAIVYSIVKQHDGFIDVKSELNAGTSFRVFLPVSEVAVGRSATDDGHAESHLPCRSMREGSGTILVVEDEALLRNFLNTFLQRRGYSVILAEDGEEALRKYAANKKAIDMAILDVVLPKKNGREVYEEMRSEDPDVRVLFISGYTGDILTATGIHNEGLDFLPKPLDVETFIEKVRTILGTQ